MQNPNDFDMHLGIAFTYKELQQFDLAEKHIKKAFQYNPGSAQVNFALGWTYLMQDRPELAEEEIIKAIRKNPYDGGFYVGLAYVYLERARAGEIIEADKLISATTRAAELDPQLSGIVYDPRRVLSTGGESGGGTQSDRVGCPHFPEQSVGAYPRRRNLS